MSIYLNAITGSRELEGCPMDKAITTMAIRLAKLRKNLKNEPTPTIDLTVMLPGQHCAPDFKGMRMTQYSATDNLLYMESAIPETMLHSPHAENYLSALLEDALENAKSFFKEQGIKFSPEPLQDAFQSP